jgi:hypothetical protein
MLGPLATPQVAWAQSTQAIAEKLFLDGRSLMTAGHVHEACEKFADSQKADPALGTLMHLALCHEKDGRSATAWSEFTDAAEQAKNAGQHDREQFARGHVATLEKRLQKVVIEVQPAVRGLSVTLDEQPLPSGVVGSEIPLDPGDHDLEVTAPGKKAWRKANLNLGTSPGITHVQVALEDDVAAGGSAPGLGGASPAGPAGIPPTEASAGTPPPVHDTGAPRSGQTAKRIAGIGLGVVGLGLGIGAVIEESVSQSRKSDEAKYSAPSAAQQLAEVDDQSKTAQSYAIVLGASGIVAIGAGIFLVLTSSGDAPAASAAPVAPSAAVRVAPLVGPHVRGLALAGSF